MSEVYTRFGIEKYLNGFIVTKGYSWENPTHAYYLLLGLELVDLKNFLNDMENNIKNQRKSIVDEDQDALNFMLSSNFDAAFRIDRQYPLILRSSVFTVIYSLFEKALINICALHWRIDINDIKNKKSKIDNSKEFIEKKLRRRLDVDWNIITAYRKVRNGLVHGVDEKTRNVAKKNRGKGDRSK